MQRVPVYIEIDLMHMCVYVCVCLHFPIYGGLPGLCIAELQQRLSFGLLIPFYSTGIMCYSNPNPIWGVEVARG